MAYEVQNVMEKIVEYMDHFNRPFNCKLPRKMSRAHTLDCCLCASVHMRKLVAMWWSRW